MTRTLSALTETEDKDSKEVLRIRAAKDAAAMEERVNIIVNVKKGANVIGEIDVLVLLGISSFSY